MCLGKTDAGAVLDLIVDLLQVFAGTAADLEEKIKFAGQVVAGNDIRRIVDISDKVIIITGMLHPYFHQNSDIISELMVIGDDGIRTDQAAFFHFFDPFDDG